MKIKILEGQEDIVLINGALNHLAISGRFREGRTFDTLEFTIDDVTISKQVSIKEGEYITLSKCSHSEGYTLEKIYLIGGNLIFVSEVDYLGLGRDCTAKDIQAVYYTAEKKFYVDISSKEKNSLEEEIQKVYPNAFVS